MSPATKSYDSDNRVCEIMQLHLNPVFTLNLGVAKSQDPVLYFRNFIVSTNLLTRCRITIHNFVNCN